MNDEGNVDNPRLDLPNEPFKDALTAASHLTGRDVRIIPNEFGAKKPTLKGWPEARLSEGDLSQHFAGDKNVGVLLGEPSRWLVTVDLDCEEARTVADDFLPPTLIGGRSGTPGSHRFYFAPNATTKSWQIREVGTVLEIRSTGAQILVEPSIHPSGDHYRFSRAGETEPVEISPEDLTAGCRQIASVVAIARNMPDRGRHSYALALSGFLLRDVNLDHYTVDRIARAAWRLVSADAKALEDVARAVRSSAARLGAGESITGGSGLDEVAPGLRSTLKKTFGISERTSSTSRSSRREGPPTHDELRDRFLDRYEGKIAFGQGRWRIYDEGIWTDVPDETVSSEIDDILTEAKPEGTRPTAAARRSVEAMARSRAFVEDRRWDARDDIVVCRNGTLEIDGRRLRPHSPEDYALSRVPYDYDPHAVARSWRQFIQSTVPDAEDFLQQFAGYALTPETLHEIALWLYGPPGSGKSTFIEGLIAMLGERVGLLGLADVLRSQFALAGIVGKTLLTATEQPSDFLSSTHSLNALISGEELSVERKYRDAFSYRPKAKVLWAMNDLPRIKDANSGLFRRVKVVEFPKLDVTPDLDLKNRIRAEAPGILNWALDGLDRLRANGRFTIPASVVGATGEFKRLSDVVANFVEEACLVSDEGFEVSTGELYHAYNHWCRTNGHKPLSSTAIAPEWRRLGFGERILRGKKIRTGLKLDSQWEAAQGEGYSR